MLKKVSKGHRNIVTLHDYFEVRSHTASIPMALKSNIAITQTAHNLYLCFDLCTGGELFDRICAKGNYYEECVFFCSPRPRPT